MTANSLIMRAREALTGVIDPKTGRNIVSQGQIAGLNVNDEGVVRFTLEVDAMDDVARALLEQSKQAVAAVDGVARVAAVATSHQAGGKPSVAPSPSSGRSPSPSGAMQGGHANPMGLRKKAPTPSDAPLLPGVKHVIAVASGKGGVGKSTVAANLAVAFAQKGLRTGLLDADIYGPSLPTLFGLKQKPMMRDDKIVPLEAYGVRAMSIGLLVDSETAIAWRGPMVMGALKQLLGDVDWGELDLLIIDTPPGTGDVHLSLAQTKRLTGAVIVSTPQEMALADVRRGAAFFRKTNTPVLGVIENMAWLEGADGARMHLFGEGGAQKAAADLEAPFLGALPIMPDLRAASDAGAPLTANTRAPEQSQEQENAVPQAAVQQAFDALCAKIMEQLA